MKYIKYIPTISSIRGISFFWILMKLMTMPLWLDDRLFPVIPFQSSFCIPFINIHSLLFYLSIFFLLILLLKNSRVVMIGLFVVEGLSCYLDINRIQPWELMLLVLLLIHLVYPKNIESIKKWTLILLISIYICSGLHKLNRGFLDHVWFEFILMDIFNFQLTTILKYKLYFLGVLIPVSEIVLGILLIFAKNKKYILKFCVFLHLIILLIIGPFGANYNSVVCIWNLLILYLIIQLINQKWNFQSLKIMRKELIILLFWLGFLLINMSGKGYRYFSFELYGGKNCYFEVTLKNSGGQLSSISKGKKNINGNDWSVNELNCALSPDFKTNKLIVNQLLLQYKDEIDFITLIDLGNRTSTKYYPK